jgi:hypothetical protein
VLTRNVEITRLDINNTFNKNKTLNKIQTLINQIKNSNKFKPPLVDNSFHLNPLYLQTKEDK